MKTKHEIWKKAMCQNLYVPFNKIEYDMTEDTYIHSMLCGNRDRFSDIKTSDKNMIPLSSGYLNGSYILGKKYIATQFPMSNTINDFWTMIMETGSKIIINLTGDSKHLRFKTKFDLNIKTYFEDNID